MSDEAKNSGTVGTVPKFTLSRLSSRKLKSKIVRKSVRKTVPRTMPRTVNLYALERCRYGLFVHPPLQRRQSQS